MPYFSPLHIKQMARSLFLLGRHKLAIEAYKQAESRTAHTPAAGHTGAPNEAQWMTFKFGALLTLAPYFSTIFAILFTPDKN